MFEMNLRGVWCCVMMLCSTGCFMETRTFSMLVKNDTSEPVSVCITKTYSPPEKMWISPEELAAPPHPATDQTPPGKVIPPGKTLSVLNFTGRFDRDHGRAFLRIYTGTPNLTQMLSISSASRNRIDVPLQVGMNQYLLKLDLNGFITATRTQVAAASPH